MKSENQKKTGIVLMNLGSPDSTEVKDVKRYLNEFLMDERVIDYPYLLRLLLVRGIIVPFRAKKSAEAYQSIWWKDGSPLIVLTNQLRDQLEKDIDLPVSIAMRYGNPDPHSAYKELLSRHPDLDQVILIPLYPHYAMSSYETAAEYAKDCYREGGYTFELSVLSPYYEEEVYIQALKESIEPHLERSYDHLLFSYHGVPKRHILKGDVTKSHCLKTDNCCMTSSKAHEFCYRHQCVRTTELVAEALGLEKDNYSVSFQSRLGREEWLQPYTAQQFEEFPSKGVKNLLVVCPAFVSDCLETLEEIEEEGKEMFMEAGGESFHMIPCLNTHPTWIRALKSMVSNDTLLEVTQR